MIISFEIIDFGEPIGKHGTSALSVANDPPLTIFPWALRWGHRDKTAIASRT